MVPGGADVTARSALAWTVGHDGQGPPLAAAVAEMNRHAPFTADDEVVASAPRRAHLVGGVLRVVSPASNFHDYLAAEVRSILRELLSGRGIAIAPSAVRTNDDTTVRAADVAAYLGRTAADLRDATYVRYVPDLVVEVLSTSTAAEDRGDEKAEYQALGVREYYLLDPGSGGVEAWVLRGGRYAPLAPVEGRYPSEVVGGPWSPADALPPA